MLVLYLYSQSQNEADSKLPSRLQIVFLLVRSACIFALNSGTHRIFTQKFNVGDRTFYDTSEALTIANQPEVPKS